MVGDLGVPIWGPCQRGLCPIGNCRLPLGACGIGSSTTKLRRIMTRSVINNDHQATIATATIVPRSLPHHHHLLLSPLLPLRPSPDLTQPSLQHLRRTSLPVAPFALSIFAAVAGSAASALDSDTVVNTSTWVPSTAPFQAHLSQGFITPSISTSMAPRRRSLPHHPTSQRTRPRSQ